MKPLSECRLYGFVDAAYLHGRDPAWIATQLCEGGADLVQLRAKDLPVVKVLEMAKAVGPVLRRAGVGFVVNDHLEIAREVGADMCHLGQEDFFDSGRKHVRELETRAPGVAIGLSTHAPAQALRAVAAGPAYVAIGPVYATNTKPSARPVTLDYVQWAAKNVSIPWFAIGGVNMNTLDAVLAAGATRVCVVSAILNAKDVAEECARFREKLGRVTS